MRPVARAAIVLGLIVVVGLARAAPAQDAQRWLSDRLTALAADPRIAPARVGLSVVELASGKPLVRLRPAEGFNVASNIKLVTVAAALALLGPEFRMRTALYAPAVRAGVIEGDLYLKGFGDPSLMQTHLWQLVMELYDSGIRRVRGGVTIDESYFDGERLAPLFGEHTSDEWYRAPNGALSLEHNAVSVGVLASEHAGEPARVLLRPSSSYLRLVNQTLTTAAGRRSWVDVRTRPEGNRTVVEVSGRVRLGYRGRPFRRRIEDPGLLTGATLLDMLEQRGIRLGRTAIARGTVPESLRPLASHGSEPLAVQLRTVSKQSNNFVAEQLLKVLGAEVVGAPGTWAKGLKAVSGYLASLGIQPGSYAMKNGSGLYEATRFSPQQLVLVTRQAALNFKYGHEFVAALALSGVDGTLGHRFVGSGAERYIRAKTGTLAHVVTLTGIAGSSTNKGQLVFSICVNDLAPGRVEAGRAVVDEMAAALVTFLER